MDVKAFPSRPSVPLLITNSKKEFDIMAAMKYSQLMALSTVLMRIVFNVLVRNCEDESRILNDLHRITIFSFTISIKSTRDLI
ncbi:hypothetical protein T01_13636, partial [Trichinella spiralis]